MKNLKLLGVVLVFFAVLLPSIVWSYTAELKKALTPQCQANCGSYLGTVCPGATWLPVQSYIGFTSVTVLILSGLFLIVKDFGDEREERWKKALSKLEGDERALFEMIINAGGAAFQADLVNESGFSKAKVSRTLDKLEARGLIERRRRGMTNLLLAK